MPNAFCEAMLYDYFPVASGVNLNAELIGGSGFVEVSQN